MLAEDLVGDWNIKFETPNGVVAPSMTLKMEGDKLGGTYHSTVFGENPIKDLKLKDGKLSFVLAFANDNGEIQVNYKDDDDDDDKDD